MASSFALRLNPLVIVLYMLRLKSPKCLAMLESCQLPPKGVWRILFWHGPEVSLFQQTLSISQNSNGFPVRNVAGIHECSHLVGSCRLPLGVSRVDYLRLHVLQVGIPLLA